jgi:signal transduction histidine kinase
LDPQLAALAVHDLKNALGALEGQLTALEASPSREAARSARRRCTALRRRLVSFLTLYRDAETLRALPADESPREILDSIVRHAEPEAEGAPAVTVRLADCATAPAFWYFDARLVRLALDAALHNATRFAAREVVVDAAAADGGLLVSIDDDGPGLAAGSARGAGSDWSTGLGTALARAVARAHRHGGREGRVQLADRPGGGARFELWLP